MKKLSYINIISIIILILILQRNVFSQKDWVMQNSGVNFRLNDIYFVDSLYGWAVGAGRDVIATTDGGMNWRKIYTLSDTVELKQIQFINRDIGFSGGNVIKKYPTYESRQALLIHTVDGGFTWSKLSIPFDSSFSFGSTRFLNSDTGWVSINNNGQISWNDRRGVMLKTTDGGTSWIILKEESFLLTEAFVFVNNEDGYSFWSPFRDNYDDSYVYFTHDAGKTWNWVGTIKEDLIKMVKCINSDILWAIGFKTSQSQNGGKDWQSWNWFSPIEGGQKRFIPTNISLLDSNNILLVGGAMSSPNDIEARLYRTNDSGNNWTIDLQLQNRSFSAIALVNKKKAWIVGSNGLIMHTADITTDIISEKYPNPEVFNLEQNFPNPFNSSTVIEYFLPITGDITIKIFDVLGRTLKTISKLNQGTGSHRIIWDGTNDKNEPVASGIYIYQLFSNGTIQTKKMNLIR